MGTTTMLHSHRVPTGELEGLGEDREIERPWLLDVADTGDHGRKQDWRGPVKGLGAGMKVR